jgi:hypothetical protein
MIDASNDVTTPMYSPDRQAAVRVSVGPFGAQAVELFTFHGLRKEVVYWGDTSSMRWTDASHLVVEYQGAGDYGEGASCPGSKIVAVSCIATPQDVTAW